MVLRMTSAHRHPKTGVYKFRKRVPERLRPILGRTEVTISLGTKDPHEARRLHAQVSAEIEKQWAALLATPPAPSVPRRVALTEKQAYALAGEAYRKLVAARDDNPGRSALRPLLAAQARTAFNLASRGGLDIDDQEFVEKVAGGAVDGLLMKMGMIVDEPSRLKACRAVAKAIAHAHEAIVRRANGDWSPDPAAASFPPLEVLDTMDWEVSFESYVKASQMTAKTARSWRKRVGELMTRVGTRDLRKLTADHVDAWKDELLASGLHPNTVRDGYLAAVKGLCGHVVRKLPTNPTLGVRVRRVKNQKLRDKGFELNEAQVILRATLDLPPSRMTDDQKAARRWVPWLCSYSGARVNEMTQLRAEDVFQERSEGGELVWMMRITPDAGNVKNRQARTVPLHPHLLEQGFLEFVRSCRRPTLFYDARRMRGGSETHPLYQKTGERLAAWVRSLGVDDPEVDPNHGWRHRFRTVARSVKLDEALIGRLQGHAPGSVGEEYGDRWPIVLFDAIASLPRYEVATAPAR